VPTGVALRDPRAQLFKAAERILLRDGPNALTSRAVTAEAEVAKGVLHRHFADFDALLTELTLDRCARIDAAAAVLRAAAGAGTVAGNLAAALSTEALNPVVLGLIRLNIARDELRTRLRAVTGSRLPLASKSTAMIAGYLAAEQDLGRIAPGADTGTLAATLVGAAHLAAADADGAPDAAALGRIIGAVIAGATP